MPFILIFVYSVMAASAIYADNPIAPIFNRVPLIDKPYAALALGSIKPEGWLLDELQRMASGMTGHLDEWYPEACGPSNAWLGGQGDCWERGPYWIDGLYPLARLLEDKTLEAKAMKWINWTIENQRSDGYIGPVELDHDDRTEPIHPGAQVTDADDWWPRMVMLKILQQHVMATGDKRAIECLRKYFQYQLETLPDAPLHEPNNPRSGSWWGAQRGGDNLLVVLWFYNLTGESFLLDLADIIYSQTVPVTEWFQSGPNNRVRYRGDQTSNSLHCVNFAQMLKTPTVRWQQDHEQRHLKATEFALDDIRTFHGQPNGMYGGDELLHGHSPTRGSELCSAVELMYSLETMLEITGDPKHADRLERIAFNALPTQCTDDYRTRQYFQQTNQIQISEGERDFFNDGGDRLVYGLLTGYPCCTCNLHQGWPKFTQSLWFATQDKGLAALIYAPSTVTAEVAEGQQVTLRQSGGYPFDTKVLIDVLSSEDARFPLHVRIPSWCSNSSIEINSRPINEELSPGSIHVIERVWKEGDRVTIRMPMPLWSSRWFNRSVSIERGPLVFALDIPSERREVELPRSIGVPKTARHRGFFEYFPTEIWAWGVPEQTVQDLNRHVDVNVAAAIPLNPWSSESAPVEISLSGVHIPDWELDRNSASNPPMSPLQAAPEDEVRSLRLIPYGATTLRIAEFPVVYGVPNLEDGADIKLP